MKYLIAGLGNIGTEYEGTRHNVGFDVVDSLVQGAEGKFEPGRKVHVAQIRHKGRTLIVIKPTTYMNLSGEAIQYWMQQEKISPENLLVITDDLALPYGTLRLRPKGGSAGHNGLVSIIECLGTENFPRLRFGIGSDFAKGHQVQFVLSRWEKNELELLPSRIKTACDIIKAFTTMGLQQTMNLFNTKNIKET